MLAAIAVVLMFAGVGGGNGSQVAAAAGPNEYGPPEWWPLRGENLVGCARNSPGTICEGNYHPVWAVDIEGPEGQSVYAAGAGLAKVYSDTTGCTGYGRAVVIEHGGSVKSLYAHFSNFSADIAANPNGVWVDQNTVIGYVGHTGNVSRCATRRRRTEVSGHRRPIPVP
jgi:murein DD-endopeptidase MepM/ murein hydrolase activator NlpD